MSNIDKIKINSAELLDILKTNQQAHAKEIANLREARREEMIDLFEDELNKIKTEKDYQPEAFIQCPIITDYSDHYNRAIRMLELSVNKQIKLDEQQFDRLVMDNWEWKNEMRASNTFYAGKLG